MLHISPGMRLALISLIAIGTIAGLFSAYKRFHVEAGNRRVEIALEWQEVSLLAQTAHRPVEDVLAEFKKSHATTLVLFEDTLNSLEQSGYLHPNRPEMKSSIANCIVDVPDREMFERIYSALKLRGLKPYLTGSSDSNSSSMDNKPQTPPRTAFRTVSSSPDSSTALFYVNADYSALRTVGIGLSPEALMSAKIAGYRIAGRIGNSSGINEAATFDLLKALYDQGVSTVIFTGDEVLGYRGLEKQVASLLKPNLETGHNPFPGMAYGEVEFGKQKGDEKLSVALNGDYIRVHSIQSAEMSQLGEEEAVDRFVRAARERNIRFCYVRLFTLVGNDPVADRNAGLVNGIGIARHQRVPPCQRFALAEAAIRAGGRQPIDLADHRRGQGDAVGHAAAAFDIVGTLAGMRVQQTAGDVGKTQQFGVFVPQLVQAATAAPVAQRFPLFVGHLLQGFGFPEGRGRGHRGGNL